jgi:hypothetical protein
MNNIYKVIHLMNNIYIQLNKKKNKQKKTYIL